METPTSVTWVWRWWGEGFRAQNRTCLSLRIHVKYSCDQISLRTTGPYYLSFLVSETTICLFDKFRFETINDQKTLTVRHQRDSGSKEERAFNPNNVGILSHRHSHSTLLHRVQTMYFYKTRTRIRGVDGERSRLKSLKDTVLFGFVSHHTRYLPLSLV